MNKKSFIALFKMLKSRNFQKTFHKKGDEKPDF